MGSLSRRYQKYNGSSNLSRKVDGVLFAPIDHGLGRVEAGADEHLSDPADRPPRGVCALVANHNCVHAACAARVSGQPKQKIFFLLDEFAHLGKMRTLQRDIGCAGGLGVAFWLLNAGSFAAAEHLWRNVPTFLANADALQTFGTNDGDTGEYLSKIGLRIFTIGRCDLEQKQIRSTRKRFPRIRPLCSVACDQRFESSRNCWVKGGRRLYGAPLRFHSRVVGLQLRVNLSGSVPLGIYRVVAEVPHKGSTVLSCLPESVAPLEKGRGQ